MVMTDEHLKEIHLKPRTSREYLDLMYIIVNIEHFYRKTNMSKMLQGLPKMKDVEKDVKEFLAKYETLKKKVKRKM